MKDFELNVTPQNEFWSEINQMSGDEIINMLGKRADELRAKYPNASPNIEIGNPVSEDDVRLVLLKEKLRKAGEFKLHQ